MTDQASPRYIVVDDTIISTGQPCWRVFDTSDENSWGKSDFHGGKFKSRNNAQAHADEMNAYAARRAQERADAFIARMTTGGTTIGQAHAWTILQVYCRTVRR
jgi:cysteine synthase